MEETSVSTSSSIGIIINKEFERNRELPPDIEKLMTEYRYDKADGFIHGKHSGKVIKMTTEKTKVDFADFKNIIPHINVNNKTNIKGEEQNMENQKAMDTLFNELKLDMREREERTRREISEREERFERQMEKYALDAAAREERFITESKDRELRITGGIDKLDSKIESQVEHIETMKNQNWWGNMAMFGAMLAIVITLIVALVIAL